MTETVTMSYRERDHLKVVGRVGAGELTVAEAAENIHLTERQMYRLLRRYRQEGDRGLIDRLRGRQSNLAYAGEISTKAMRLYRELYSDYGPTLAESARIVRSVNAVTVQARSCSPMALSTIGSKDVRQNALSWSPSMTFPAR